MTARQLAFEVLLNIKTNSAYSNNALTEAFSAHELSVQDKAFVTEIVYGTLTHYRLLQYWLEPYYQGRVKDWIKILLGLTLYQLNFLEKIPDYAAISEAVELAKNRGGEFNAKVVNSVLRKVKTRAIVADDELEQLAIEYSHPTWLVRLWHAQFGIERTTAMMIANNERAPMMLRVNNFKTNRKILIGKLKDAGLTCETGQLSDSAILVKKGNPLTTKAFTSGLFYVQDEASQLPALALAPPKGARVLDVCAAPGGKTFHLAELVGDTGVVKAFDIYQHKIDRMRENANRLGITNVEMAVCSALDLHEIYEPISFDYILVDAPCSGLGILRRHPEAKLTKKPEDLDEIIEIQKAILDQTSQLLAPGGRLVYSTCTVNRKENHKQVEAFLKANEDFLLDEGFESRMPTELVGNFENGMLQLFPQDFNTDGFFIASLIRK